MIGEPRGLGALDEILEFAQVLAIGFFCGTKIHGDAVLHDFVLLENLIEDLHGASAIDHKILRNNFEPIDDWLALQDVLVVGRAQTDADAIFGEIIEAVGTHASSRR